MAPKGAAAHSLGTTGALGGGMDASAHLCILSSQLATLTGYHFTQDIPVYTVGLHSPNSMQDDLSAKYLISVMYQITCWRLCADSLFVSV